MKRTKQGRFSWVKRFIQSKSMPPQKEHFKRDHIALNHRSSKSEDNSAGNSRKTARFQGKQVDDESSTNAGAQSVNFENDSRKAYSKSPSIADTSVTTRFDNASTRPMISISTISARSSTFSDHSHQTSNTVQSDHPTLFTNASTTGIPPASIMDRRDHVNRQLSMSSHLYTTNNSSNHTFNTVMSPVSVPNMTQHNDESSEVSK